MTPKTPQESEIYEQMVTMLKDQFYHQTGDNIIINRMELADMLTKQTVHGIYKGLQEIKPIIPCPTTN